MNAIAHRATFKVPALSRKQLARAEYDRAYRELLADRDAGRISPADAKVKFDAITAVYQQKKQDAELAAFLGERGLSGVVGVGA